MLETKTNTNRMKINNYEFLHCRCGVPLSVANINKYQTRVAPDKSKRERDYKNDHIYLIILPGAS